MQKIRDLSLRAGEQPFFLTVSFTNPHDPWEIRQRYWDLYDERAIGLPHVGALPRDEADAHSLRLRDMIGLDRSPLSEADVRRARHGYYAAISYLDERVGELLDALAATGLERETVVVFTSDHGELLGERGLWYKMSFLEGSARVPLIVRGPGLRGAARGEARLATRPRPHARRARRRARRRGRIRGPQPGRARSRATRRPVRRSASTSPRACGRRP